MNAWRSLVERVSREEISWMVTFTNDLFLTFSAALSLNLFYITVVMLKKLIIKVIFNPITSHLPTDHSFYVMVYQHFNQLCLS